MKEAKAKLSEVIKCAESEGPQDITLHGRPVAVVMTRTLYDQLTGNERSFVEFMQQSPLFGLEDISLERDHTLSSFLKYRLASFFYRAHPADRYKGD